MKNQSLRLSPKFAFLFPAVIAILFGAQQTQLQAAAPKPFDPVAFFTGSTESRGTLKKALSNKQATHVTGTGVVRPDGQLIIDQIVRIEGEKTTTRHWQLRQTKPGNYAGTISDAKGVVTAVVAGNQLAIKYKMNDGGYSVSQTLTAAPDGKSVHNEMKIRKFGIVFATIDEIIRKV